MIIYNSYLLNKIAQAPVYLIEFVYVIQFKYEESAHRCCLVFSEKNKGTNITGLGHIKSETKFLKCHFPLCSNIVHFLY